MTSYMLASIALSCSSPKDPTTDSLHDTGITGYNIQSYVSTDSDWIYINSGLSHSCGMKEDGSIICWGCQDPSPEDTGYNYYNKGQCAAPSGSFSYLGDSWRSANCAISNVGLLNCWGDEDISQFFPKIENALQVSTGDDYACVLGTLNNIQCWGLFGDYDPPKDIYKSKILSMTVGEFYGCAILEDGKVECWGIIDYSLGDQLFQNDLFSQISLGAYQACGISTKGSAYCWGRNKSSKPENLPGAFTQVGVGDDDFVCAINTDGEIECWGDDVLVHATPTSGKFVKLDVGWYHACALRDDGHVVCWGSNASGEVEIP